MNINYLPKKGVKLTGSESGVWLVDSINNDSLLSIKDGWTAYPSTNQITIEKDIITFNFDTTFEWIGVSVPFETVIGQTYSVIGLFLSPPNIGSVENAKFGVTDTPVANTPTKLFHSEDRVTIPNTVYTVTFTAALTTYWVHWSAALDPTVQANRIFTIKNEIEIRTAEVIGVDETTEINTVANAVNPTSDSNSTTDWASSALAGTGLNIFEVVNNNESYPELHTYANAASDPNGNEANATIGFNQVNVSPNFISQSSVVNTGVYAIHAELNTTPFVNGRFYCNLEDATFDLQDGKRYKIKVFARHDGTGGDWGISIGEFNTGQAAFLVTLTSSDTTYTEYSITFVKGVTSHYLAFHEFNGSNDGGIYVDNLSITQTNEYYLSENAASDTLSEKDSIVGWIAGNNAVITSVSSPVDTGSFAISIEGNTTPTNSSVGVIKLNSSGLDLGDGQYTISFSARHNGTGGDWTIRIVGSINTDIVTLTNADTTYSDYSITFVMNGGDYTDLQGVESNGPGDGGVYIDNISVQEVQVNHGTYAFHAESNDTPTNGARINQDLKTTHGLTDGKRYILSIDAKHVGVGDDWVLSLASGGTGDTTAIFKTLSNTDTSFKTYSITFVLDSQNDYFIARELNGSNDGGVYIDKLSIKETGELYPAGNAASDSSTESDTINDWITASSAIITSVTSPVDSGTYALSIESNTTPTSLARAYIPLSLTIGTRCSISMRARHNGVGEGWRVFLSKDNTAVGGDVLFFDLVNTDTSYESFTFTFTFSIESTYLVCKENTGSNDGGVYIDNISIRTLLPDLSAVDKGVYTFGLIHKSVVNFNADTVGYSEYGSNDLIRQHYNSNLDFGTTGFTISGWIKCTTTSTEFFFDRSYYNGVVYVGSGIRIRVSNGDLRCEISDDAFLSNDNIITDSEINDNAWHHFAFINNATVVLKLYIDGGSAASDVNIIQALGSLSNTAAELTIGGTNESGGQFSGRLANLKMDPTILTETQIKNIYNSERVLFQRDSAFSIFDNKIDLPIRPQSMTRSAETQRNQNISLGGQRETLFTRQNSLWDVNTTTIDIVDLKYYRLFLDSVVKGQVFTFDPDGTAVAPTDPKLVTYEDSQYTEVREGQLNKFRLKFKVKE